jgi:hypothetical protein
MEGMEEIRAIVIRYGRTLNARDFGACSRLVALDCEWACHLPTNFTIDAKSDNMVRLDEFLHTFLDIPNSGAPATK